MLDKYFYDAWLWLYNFSKLMKIGVNLHDGCSKYLWNMLLIFHVKVVIYIAVQNWSLNCWEYNMELVWSKVNFKFCRFRIIMIYVKGFAPRKVSFLNRGIGEELIDSREIIRIFWAQVSSSSMRTARSAELYSLNRMVFIIPDIMWAKVNWRKKSRPLVHIK